MCWRRCAARSARSGHAVDHVDYEVEAVEVVEHHHVERRRGGALLLVAAHVDVVVVGAPVGETVDQLRVAVVGEDHRAPGGEQRVELLLGESVRVLDVGLQAHQVDDVDDPHLQLRAARAAGSRRRRAPRASARRPRTRAPRRAPSPRRCSPSPTLRSRACSARSRRPSRGSRARAACRRRSR